jgi:hypothetical protein
LAARKGQEHAVDDLRGRGAFRWALYFRVSRPPPPPRARCTDCSIYRACPSTISHERGRGREREREGERENVVGECARARVCVCTCVCMYL